MSTELLVSGRRARGAEENRTQPAGLAAATVLYCHRILSLALSTAVRQRLLPRNPCADATPPRVPRAESTSAGKKKIRALDRDHLHKLLPGFKGSALFPIVAVAAATGACRGEILGMTWSAIDFEAKELRILQSLEDTAAHGLRLKEPKTESSRRTIGIDAGPAALLRSERRRQAEEALKFGLRLPADALMFPRRPYEPTLSREPRHVTKTFSDRAAKRGFSGLRFHDLRHTHATLLLQAGVPINAVAQRLGHASSVVTLEVYGHVLKQAEDRAVSVAGSLLASALADR